jgi:hypothetical protein
VNLFLACSSVYPVPKLGLGREEVLEMAAFIRTGEMTFGSTIRPLIKANCGSGPNEEGENVVVEPAPTARESFVIFLEAIQKFKMQGQMAFELGSTVVVVSLWSDLNGRRGIVQNFAPASGRYGVQIDGEPQICVVKPTNLQAAPAIGSKVIMVSLVSRSDLNGRRGVVKGFNCKTTCFEVKVDGEETILSLHHENLREVSQFSGLHGRHVNMAIMSSCGFVIRDTQGVHLNDIAPNAAHGSCLDVYWFASEPNRVYGSVVYKIEDTEAEKDEKIAGVMELPTLA